MTSFDSKGWLLRYWLVRMLFRLLEALDKINFTLLLLQNNAALKQTFSSEIYENQFAYLSRGDISLKMQTQITWDQWFIHNARDWNGTRKDEFLDYAMYCTHYTGTRNGTGNGNGDQWAPYPFPPSRSHFLSCSLSRSCSRSCAVWTSHNSPLAKTIKLTPAAAVTLLFSHQVTNCCVMPWLIIHKFNLRRSLTMLHCLRQVS